MKVIPAIDIMQGRCVQLVGGNPATKKDFGDPIDVALDFMHRGAKRLHLIDLDATLGLGDNTTSILKVKEAFKGPVEVGGGLRTVEKANQMLDALSPDDRIIMGTLIVNEFPGFDSLDGIKDAENRLIVSVDSKGGNVTVSGWQADSGLNASHLMDALLGRVWGFLYTNVDVEGRMHGIDKVAVQDIVSSTGGNVIVSGGISSISDIDACEAAGAWGVVIGKAVYEGVLDIDKVL